jgi:hypothetical protein
MTHDSTRPTILPFQAQAELELLQLILQSETPYPWNPADIGAEGYFAELEREVTANWEAEIMAQGQVLAAHVHQLWSAIAPIEENSRSMLNELLDHFAVQMPEQLLETIVQRAQQLLSTNASLADKLVACVQDLLPGWGEDDLYVLARPLAYAMRGSDDSAPQSALQSAEQAPWSELSAIDQAKLSLAIAHYTLSKLS